MINFIRRDWTIEDLCESYVAKLYRERQYAIEISQR